ncbi:hypothetical protein D9756_009636 [Leucocoprinus leucothites]|uniref:Transmembrane protein n=1 Tax=Leucocoprinus leucothites TaxID=201217 RepID=A0A8H5FTX9_9AGAR|nr:hypothetical protein D9756_009636 [Leucoagaricus leucothites]
MRAFATIATFAVLAFSAVTSALPSPAGAVANVVNGSPSAPTVAPSADDLKSNLYKAMQPVPTPSGGHGGPKGIPDVLVEVNAKVLPLIKDLTVKIDAEVDVHVILDLAVKVFAEIKGIVHAACDDIKAVIKADVSVVLNLKGILVDVHVCAQILAQLLNVIVLAIALVVKLCVSIDVSVLLKIAASITADLSLIVKLVVSAVVGIDVLLKGVLSLVANICVGLKLNILVNVLAKLGLGLHL